MNDSALAAPIDTASILTREDLLEVIDRSIDLATHFKQKGPGACAAVAMRCGNSIYRRSWLFLWRRLKFEVPTARYVYFFPETYQGRRYGILKKEFGGVLGGLVVTTESHPLIYMKGYEEDTLVELVPHNRTLPSDFITYALEQLEGFTRKRSIA